MIIMIIILAVNGFELHMTIHYFW